MGSGISSSSSTSGFSSPSTSLSSSPEPTNDDGSAMGERLKRLLDKQSCEMRSMLRVISIITESSSDEKVKFIRIGVLSQLCHLIGSHNNLEYRIRPFPNNGRRKRPTLQGSQLFIRSHSNHPELTTKPNASIIVSYDASIQDSNTQYFVKSHQITRDISSASSTNSRGIGYGRGSIKSHWDIERTVEERITQEEHLMWLLNALNAFLWGDSHYEKICQSIKTKASDFQPAGLPYIEEDNPHLCNELYDEIINNSKIFTLLEYHLNNDSVFDVSQHIDFYQALVELTAGLSLIPMFMPNLMSTYEGGKSIAKDLIPKFCDTLNTYPQILRGHISPDLIFTNFIQKIHDLTEVILTMVQRYENSLLISMNCTNVEFLNTNSTEIPESILDEYKNDDKSCINILAAEEKIAFNQLYSKCLRDYQFNTFKLINDDNKPIYGFSYKKELRHSNPFSSSLKDRTTRIAKELASMHNSLPLNDSNSIFICMDEMRCDILKVLITGPDDTPYQNGMFEFDIFFPINYPFSPPKCNFLTTGGGNIRFNPNLYSDGKICLSILGTWEGRPEEKWNSFCSLLQVLISIQGLIFVKHPYFNEPGFEKFEGTPEGNIFTKRYNSHVENATLLCAIGDQYRNPPPYFRDVILRHFWLKRDAIIAQAERWLLNVARQSRDERNDDEQSLLQEQGECVIVDGIAITPLIQAKKRASFIRQIQINSSLVRRARLIRRRTTNQYCEKLKKLQEEDAVVIHQILIIQLKPRSKANEYERACINTSSSEYIPSIEFAYPPIGSNLQKFPPPLFYPDFMKSTVQRKEDLEAFPVVLTNEKGDRKDDTSCKPNAKDGQYSVLVFASHYSHEALFHRLASDFVVNVQKDSTKLHAMCKDLLNLRLTTSDESYRYSKYVVPNSLETNEPPSKWSRGAVSTITIQKFGVENTVFIFLSLLAEKRVIVTGANITEVSLAVQSFVRLLAPLEWPHTLIPIVPDSQTELCFNPTPYICGILRYNLNRVKDLLCPLPGVQEDVTVVDVERGLILPYLMPSTHNAFNNVQNMKILLNYASSMDFPKPVVLELVHSLKTLLPVKKPLKADYKIEKRVMIFYAKLFGHFKCFGNDILTVRNRKRFVLAHPCSDTRLFLKWFVENGILQFFIFNRKSEKQKNELNERFQEILKQYSPPVDKKGKCRKAKSIMWKIFTR